MTPKEQIISIEYLINEIKEILGNTSLNSNEYLLLTNALENARKLHKKEIIDAHNMGIMKPFNNIYTQTSQWEGTKGELYYIQKFTENKFNL